MRTKETGFTLIELVIVMVIAAILAVIAIPGYQEYVMKARRTEAVTGLMETVSAREKFFLDNNAYPPTLNALSAYGIGLYTDSGNYKLSMYDTTNGTWLRATAQSSGSQYRDTECRIFLYHPASDTRKSWAWDGGWDTNPQPDPCWGSN